MAPLNMNTALAANKRPKSRKSIAHLPSPDTTGIMDKENMTIDTSAIAAKANIKLSKRSRSRSLGPGGLDALQEETGNRRKVRS
jgi:kinetochore protein Spc7/SPC105